MKKKANNFHRNRNVRTWTPLMQAIVPDEAKKMGVVAVAQNHLYTVFIKRTKSPGLEYLGPSGQVEPMPMTHLIIIRNDRKGVEIDWEHKQRIKDELCGPMCEAVELFPAKWRQQPVSQTHLWALAPGASYPLGLFPENFAGGQTPASVTVTKEDLEVFVVRGEFVEVFASEAEAKEAYEKAGNTLAGGAIERIGDVPTTDDGAAWTDAAKAKVANIIAKAEALDKMNTPKMGEDVESPFYDDGPDSVEEEVGMLFDMTVLKQHADLVYGKPGLEENIQIAEYMERKLDEIKSERVIRIGDAVKVAEKEVKEIDERAEAEAKDELDEYRRQLLRKKDSGVN